MAEGRMIKKRVSKSKKMASVKMEAARTLYFMMYPHADIGGRVEADPQIVKGEYIIYFNWSLKKIYDCLVELHRVELIIFYEVNGNLYVQFTRFSDFQSLRKDKEAESGIPVPPKGITPEQVPSYSCTTPAISKVKRSKDKLSKDNINIKPTADSVDNFKQPFPAPTEEQKKELALLHIDLTKNFKFNIFIFISKAKRISRHYPPIDLMIKISKAALKKQPDEFKKIPDDVWAYFTSVLIKEQPKYFAELQIQEHQKFKNAPIASNVKDILAEMGKGGKK